MRSTTHLRNLYVNIAAENPLFEGSLTIKDVLVGTQAVKVDVVARSLTRYELASDWYVQTKVSTGKHGEFQSATTTLVADLSDGRTVTLSDLGIHQGGEADEPNTFSVAALRDEIRYLWAWVAMEGWGSTSEKKLKELFPEYIEENERLPMYFYYF